MENIKLKHALIALFAILIAYLTITGAITADTIVELFRGLAEVGG